MKYDHWILASFLWTSLFAVVVGLLCLRLRRWPALCHGLWLLVLTRALLPVIPLAGWTWMGVVPEGRLERVLERWLREPGTPLEPSPSGGFTLLHGCLLVWMIGFVLLCARDFARMRVLRRSLRHARPLPHDLQQLLQALSTRVGVICPRGRVLQGIRSPFLIGLWRPVLVLPRGLQARELQAVLIHELAHLKRCDSWTAWIGWLAARLWWWNPLLVLALHQADRYRELACDAWVTELVPDQAPTYAHALVDRLDRERVGLPVLAMVGTRRQHVARMKERLTLLFERPAIRAPRFALGLAVAVVVASLLMPHGSATTRERPVQEPAIAEVRSPLLDTYGVASFEELEQRSGQAIEADSSNGAAWSQLGVALLMTQKIPAAMEAFERQFELGFAPTIASYNLACCYALEIEPEEALYWLQQAVQSGFDDADHIESDPDLGILQELPEFHELLVALRGGGPQVSANQ